MPVVHVRVAGWCDLCGGIGKASVGHVDVQLVGGESAAFAASAGRVVAGAAARVAAAARARLVELDAAGHGCEMVAERRFEEGRLQAVEHDLWEAAGVGPAGGVGQTSVVA